MHFITQNNHILFALIFFPALQGFFSQASCNVAGFYEEALLGMALWCVHEIESHVRQIFTYHQMIPEALTGNYTILANNWIDVVVVV